MTLRLRLGAIATVLFCTTGASPALSADYPTKPIKIVVPYSAGGSTDTLARVVAERLGKRLGPGGGGREQAGCRRADRDHQRHQGRAGRLHAHAVDAQRAGGQPGLYGPRLQYNPQKDLVPIVLAATVPSVVVVHPSVPVKNMTELGAYLKSNPGKVSYASAGAGTPSHLGMEYYKKANGFDPVHVPYKGGAPALQEVMGGQVQLMMALVPEAMPMVKSGRLRALAVTTTKRLAAYPDLPTVAESGGKDFDMTFWYAFMAPAGTPADIVTKLNTGDQRHPGRKGRSAPSSTR